MLPLLETEDVQAPSLFGASLEETLGPGLILTADDLTAERLLPRLRRLVPEWAMHAPRRSPAQVDEIRAVLYPEIRVGWAHDDAQLIEVMDREQECLAKSLGDGHHLVRGVAGNTETPECLSGASVLAGLRRERRDEVIEILEVERLGGVGNGPQLQRLGGH